MSWRGFGASCAVAALLVCQEALADRLALTWTAPADCPQAATAEARVRQLAGAGQAAETTEAPELSASVLIAKSAQNRWSATLKLGASTRLLEGESCAEVADAAIVILAMTVDPEAVQEPPDDLEATDSSAPASAVAADRPAVPVAAPQPPRAEPQSVPEKELAPVPGPPTAPAPWGASLRSFGEWGMLPAPSWGGVVALHAGWRAHLLELAALALLPRDAVLEGSTKGGEFWWFGAQLTGCQLLARPAFLCAGFEAGRLSGAGFGTREERTGHALWAAPGVELLFAPSLGGGLSLEISAGIFIALLKPEFAIEGLGVVHQPGPVSARLELGIGWY